MQDLKFSDFATLAENINMIDKNAHLYLHVVKTVKDATIKSAINIRTSPSISFVYRNRIFIVVLFGR